MLALPRRCRPDHGTHLSRWGCLFGLAPRATASPPGEGWRARCVPDTCPDRGSRWDFRRSARCSGRSVKPRLTPRWLGPDSCPFCRLGKPPRSDHPDHSNAEAQNPAGAAQSAHRCPSRIPWLHPEEGTQHSEARPVLTRQNSRFWMSAASRTIIVRGIPNGGSRMAGATRTGHRG